MAFVVWPLCTAILTLATRKRTPAEWEAWAMSKPGLALVVELLRAMGVNTPQLMIVAQRYAQRQSGVIPDGALEASTLPPGLKRILTNPQLLALVEAQAQMLLAANATPTTTPPTPR